jgi:hypothetical protein
MRNSENARLRYAPLAVTAAVLLDSSAMRSAVGDLACESLTRRERRAGAEWGRSFASEGSGDGGRCIGAAGIGQRRRRPGRVLVDRADSDRWQLVGVVGEGSGRLGNLDQMAVRIADVATDLGCVLFRGR